MRSRLIVSLAAGALLAACTPVDPGFGEAVRYDMAIQTVDPDPVYPEGSTEAGSSGTTAASAAERYRKGTVKPVETIGTATGGSGGGSGSGPQ